MFHPEAQNMTKQNDTETIEIRLSVTGRPDDIKIKTAKWFRSNKVEALDFLAQAKKPDIIADDKATPRQIHGAKMESAAFHRYMAEALNSQIATDRGELPAIPSPVPINQLPVFTPEPLTPPTPTESRKSQESDDDDDWGDDDEEPIIDID